MREDAEQRAELDGGEEFPGGGEEPPDGGELDTRPDFTPFLDRLKRPSGTP